MRKNKKIYSAPSAEITVFECADIITVSGDQLDSRIKSDTRGGSYIKIGGYSWSNSLKNSE